MGSVRFVGRWQGRGGVGRSEDVEGCAGRGREGDMSGGVGEIGYRRVRGDGEWERIGSGGRVESDIVISRGHELELEVCLRDPGECILKLGWGAILGEVARMDQNIAFRKLESITWRGVMGVTEAYEACSPR